MDKTTVMENLIVAKKDHINLVRRIKLLIEGLPVEAETIALNNTESGFGMWLYGEGQKLVALGNMEGLEEIEELNSALHDQYLKIYKTYFTTQKKLLSKTTKTVPKKVNDQEKEMAKEYYSKLADISEDLLDRLGKLERRLYSLPQSAFDGKTLDG